MKITCVIALLALIPPPESDWSQFRGPNRDGISPDTGLLKQWPAGGPPLVWKTAGLGAAFSSVSISGARLYTMGDVEGNSTLFALNLADGKVLWKTRVGQPGGNRNPGTRSTPATDGKIVVALGQFGELICVDAADGKLRWQKHLTTDFEGRRPGWDWSESPLLDGDHVLVTPGGKAGAVVALNKETGALVWRSKEFTDGAHYTSLLPVEIGGVRQYLVFTAASVAGVAAKDGKLLWKTARPGKTAICSTPVYKDGIVFVSSAYGVGHHAFKVSGKDAQFSVEPLYSGTDIESHHGGMILVGDHLYTLSGHGRGELKCLELKTGKVVWSDASVGKGSIAYADGHLVCRGEAQSKGEIALVEATPAGYKEKGRFSLPDPAGQPTWAHPVVFGGKLYIRNQDVLFCYNVKAN